MVAALGAGKSYGSSLPRLRFYTDVKLNGERIDPLLPMTDALMAWAEEAHWSMGGVSTTRRRLQGRIEGNVNKLRVQRETLFTKSGNQQKSAFSPAPTVIKRRRVLGLVEEEEEQRGNKRRAARKSWEKVTGKKDGGGVAAASKRSKRKAAAVAAAADGGGEFLKDREFQGFFGKGCVALHLHLAMALWRVIFERRLEDFALALSRVFFLVYSWREKYD